MFVSLQARLLGALAVIAAIIAAIAKIFYDGKKAGRNEVINETNAKTMDLTDKFDEIAASRPDLDASLGRLRARSGKPD